MQEEAGYPVRFVAMGLLQEAWLSLSGRVSARAVGVAKLYSNWDCCLGPVQVREPD